MLCSLFFFFFAFGNFELLNVNDTMRNDAQWVAKLSALSSFPNILQLEGHQSPGTVRHLSEMKCRQLYCHHLLQNCYKTCYKTVYGASQRSRCVLLANDATIPVYFHGVEHNLLATCL